ncbi:M23 family metallopeptidase [Longispora albida]|uniref:M23 family metallopeptidase n=1 Tax=Longispora albida TaxID=203523 RepID=UPI00039E3A88|nr:M23 family metallopeptidase [Longispora albida]
MARSRLGRQAHGWYLAAVITAVTASTGLGALIAVAEDPPPSVSVQLASTPIAAQAGQDSSHRITVRGAAGAGQQGVQVTFKSSVALTGLAATGPDSTCDIVLPGSASCLLKTTKPDTEPVVITVTGKVDQKARQGTVVYNVASVVAAKDKDTADNSSANAYVITTGGQAAPAPAAAAGGVVAPKPGGGAGKAITGMAQADISSPAADQLSSAELVFLVLGAGVAAFAIHEIWIRRRQPRHRQAAVQRWRHARNGPPKLVSDRAVSWGTASAAAVLLLGLVVGPALATSTPTPEPSPSGGGGGRAPITAVEAPGPSPQDSSVPPPPPAPPAPSLEPAPVQSPAPAPAEPPASVAPAAPAASVPAAPAPAPVETPAPAVPSAPAAPSPQPSGPASPGVPPPASKSPVAQAPASPSAVPPAAPAKPAPGRAAPGRDVPPPPVPPAKPAQATKPAAPAAPAAAPEKPARPAGPGPARPAFPDRIPEQGDSPVRAEPPSSDGAKSAALLNIVVGMTQYMRDTIARTTADKTSLLATVPGLEAQRAKNEERLRDTKAGIATLDLALTSNNAELKRLEAETEALKKAAAEPARKAVARGGRAESAQAAAGYTGGKLLRPVPGTVNSPFGDRDDPYYHRWQLHAGIDLDAAMGTPIRAAAAGVVSQAGSNDGYGLFTCIDHGQLDGDRLTTCYAHQSRLGVEPGQEIRAGAIIGWAGSTGASTGPHVHFEVRLAGQPVDPVPWL